VRPWPAAAIAATSVVLVSACALISDPPDLFYLAPLPDGGARPRDGAPDSVVFVPVDSAVPDAGLEAGAFVCPAGSICDDFEGTGTGFSWAKTENGGATVAADNVRPLLGLKSLHAVRGASADRGAAWLQSAVATPPAACEFDVFVKDTPGQPQRVEVFDIGFAPAGAPYFAWHLFVTAGTGGADSRAGDFNTLQAGGTGGKIYGSLPRLTPGAWHRVLVEVGWTAKTARVAIDGMTELNVTDLSAPASGSPYVAAGVTYQGNTDIAWEVFVDNLACKK
jgi:hypothetical protein